MSKKLACLPNIQKASAELRAVPQRGVTVCETLLYALVPLLLVMAGAMPSAALCVLPVALALLYLLFRRFGVYLPLACIIGYGVTALTVNYDVLSVIFVVALFFAFCGLVAAVQCEHYLACAAVAAIVAVTGALLGAGIVRLAENKPVADIARDYAIAEYADPVIGFFAREYYEDYEPPVGTPPKKAPTDDGYAEDVAARFGDWAADEFGLYLWYYCIHYGAIFALAAFFFAVTVNRRTACYCDANATREELALSSRCMGGVRVCVTPVSQMRMPRAYLWAVVLPAAVASVILEFVGGYDMLSATVMHTFATVPSAFTCFTLLAYFASLFNGKARIAANTVLVMSGLCMLVFPMALFILSMFGLCDCILDLRFWTEFIRTD